jgi:hypothetical protein
MRGMGIEAIEADTEIEAIAETDIGREVIVEEDTRSIIGDIVIKEKKKKNLYKLYTQNQTGS